MTDFRDDVGAYLLGALSDEESAAFERAMERDEALRKEVDSLRVAAEALPASPIQMAPPPELKGRIMVVVNAEAELLRAAGPEADRPSKPSPSRRRRRALAGLRSGGWSLRPGLAVAASVLVLAVGAGIGGIIASGGGEHSTGTREAKLIQRDGRHSTLTVTKLASAGPGRVYQVWLQRKGQDPKPTNALFDTNRDGTASVDVPGDLKGVDKVLVTNEPDGGSREPTTVPLIQVHPA